MITWLAEPDCRLIKGDGHWNTFRCVTPGAVMLDDVVVEFPLGWVTDATSSPVWARSLLPQLGAHVPAALLHDRLLDLGWPRATARYWMNEQLRELTLVSRARRWRMVSGVWLYDQTQKFTARK